jgi:hypothetical protein
VSREDRHTALEAYIRVCDPPKQGFNEFIDALAGLASKIGESFFQRGVHRDRGVRHMCHCPTPSPPGLTRRAMSLGVARTQRRGGPRAMEGKSPAASTIDRVPLRLVRFKALRERTGLSRLTI